MALEKEIKLEDNGVVVKFWTPTYQGHNLQTGVIEIIQGGWVSKEDYLAGKDMVTSRRYEITPNDQAPVVTVVEQFHKDEVIKQDDFKGAKDIGKVIRKIDSASTAVAAEPNVDKI